MVTFRNNNSRRNNFRRNDRNYKNNNVDRSKFGPSFTNNDSFQRKSPGRNNHNASKLIEKYNNLAREALSIGDKIMSENYFQHADHFMRILGEMAAVKKTKFSENASHKDELAEKNSEEKKESFSKNEEDPNKVQSDIN